MRNDDLALLCRRPVLRAGASASLPATLARLFRIDVPDPARLLSVWSLEQPVTALHANVMRRVAEAPGREEFREEVREPTASTRWIDAVEGLISSAAITELVQRQTAALIIAGDHGMVRPLFREITFSMAVLEARIAGLASVTADPFLFRHLAGRLDARMLERITEGLATGEPAIATPDGPPLHLNLRLPGILSEGFLHFAAACRARRLRAGIAVSLIEILADADRYAAARDRVAYAGLAVVLEGVSHLGLLLTAPLVLRADLVKLDWSPHLPDLPEAERARRRPHRAAARGARRRSPGACSTGSAASRGGMSTPCWRRPGSPNAPMLPNARSTNALSGRLRTARLGAASAGT
jgi:hypothetical protein